MINFVMYSFTTIKILKNKTKTRTQLRPSEGGQPLKKDMEFWMRHQRNGRWGGLDRPYKIDGVGESSI